MSLSIYLRTERLAMRPFREGDEALILQLDSDPEVMRYLTNGRPTSPDEARAMIQRVLALYRRYEDRLGLWATHLRSTGDFVGWFHLRPSKRDPDNLRDLELGYRLRQNFWRQGIATEGSQGLIQKAFEELGAATVFADTLKTNFKSIGVMKKLGMDFRLEYKDPDFDGTEWDVRYALTRETWQARATQSVV